MVIALDMIAIVRGTVVQATVTAIVIVLFSRVPRPSTLNPKLNPKTLNHDPYLGPRAPKVEGTQEGRDHNFASPTYIHEGSI